MLSDLRDLQLWLQQFDLELSSEHLEQTRCYLDTLLLWNRKMNLVSQRRPEEIITKHLADSFVAASALGDSERIVDLGSGGGFPGIPIAIAHPSSPVWLVESNQKKASFLAEAVARCGLSLVTVCAERIEVVRQRADLARQLTAVTARALSSIDELVEAAADLLAPRGRLIALKGPNYEAELGLSRRSLPKGAEGEAPPEPLGSTSIALRSGSPGDSPSQVHRTAANSCSLEEIIDYKLPDGSSRCLVVFRFT